MAVEAAPRSVTGTLAARAQRSARAASPRLTGWKITSGTARVSTRVNRPPRYTF
jgi:hypothetical protein